jgi:hypothetical protein
MYCYAIENSFENFTQLKKREKGVPGHVTNKHQFKICKKVLDDETQTHDSYKQIVRKIKCLYNRTEKRGFI